MKKNTILLASLAGLSLALACPAQAALIINETFNYTIGSTQNTAAVDEDGGLNSGSGLPYTNIGGNPSGTGTGLRGNGWGGTVVSGLTYTGQGATNNAIRATESNSFDTSVYRNMTTDPFLSLRVGGAASGNFGVDGSTLYFSFLMNTSAVGTGARSQVMITGNGGTNRLYFGLGDGASLFSINDQSGGVKNSTITATANTTYLIVAKITFTSGNETVAMWVNPTSLTEGNNTVAATQAGYDLAGGFQQVGFRYGTNALYFDEFRVGTTWADVVAVPEPSTFALLAGVAALGLIVWRRRRA